ncbi:hypothetical protein [Nitrosomonas communis]|uniref:hypothetical protein n=1 Tax=Nitrosomonas communis TaxID=44574 RepID=UPI003D2837D4
MTLSSITKRGDNILTPPGKSPGPDNPPVDPPENPPGPRNPSIDPSGNPPRLQNPPPEK